MNDKIKYASINEVKSVDSDNRTIEFVASKEILDYDHDIIKLNGLDISKIKKNKSFLWSHMQGAPPVGKILRVWKDGNLLKGKAQLTSEEEYPFGYTIYKLIKGGYINNISISFIPDWDTIERKQLKDGKYVTIIHNSTLLECSAVNIGCNTGTSISAKNLKDNINKAWDDALIDGKELNLLEEALIVEEVEMDYEAEIVKLKAAMDELKKGSYLHKIFDEVDSKEKLYQEMIDELKQ